MDSLTLGAVGKEEGSVKRRLKLALLSVLVVLTMTFGAAGAAYAAGPFWVGGGKWYHGVVSGGSVWSNYLHNYRCHKSSVKGKWWGHSGRTARGYWAKASAPERWWAVDRAYWNNRC